MGLDSPFNFFTESSLLRATINRSPFCAAASKYCICPACKMSKHPFVNTISSPRCFQVSMICSKSFRGWILDSAGGVNGDIHVCFFIDDRQYNQSNDPKEYGAKKLNGEVLDVGKRKCIITMYSIDRKRTDDHQVKSSHSSGGR